MEGILKRVGPVSDADLSFTNSEFLQKTFKEVSSQLNESHFDYYMESINGNDSRLLKLLDGML